MGGKICGDWKSNLGSLWDLNLSNPSSVKAKLQSLRESWGRTGETRRAPAEEM